MTAKCPVCDKQYTGSPRKCSNCGLILQSDEFVFGKISAEEKQKFQETTAKKRKAYQEEQRKIKQQEEDRRREADRIEREKAAKEEAKRLEAIKNEKAEQEAQRWRDEQRRLQNEKQQRISFLTNEINSNISTNPYMAQALLTELKMIDPTNFMISLYETQIQTAIDNQFNIYTPAPGYTYTPPNSYSYRKTSSPLLSNFQIPKWLWVGVLSGLIGGIIVQILPIGFSLSGFIGMGENIVVEMILWMVLGLIVSLIMYMRGDI